MDPSDEPIPIEQAPYRIRRAYLVRERRIRRLMLLAAGAVIAYVIVRIFGILG